MSDLVANILLVEDNPGDICLTRAALEEAEFVCNVHVVEDGEQALAFLRREGSHAGATRPHLILLDLSLPKVDGREVLRRMKADPELWRIPVVIFSCHLSGRMSSQHTMNMPTVMSRNLWTWTNSNRASEASRNFG